MHILQPKHTKLSEKETEEVLSNLNISKSQLPRIISKDPSLPEGVERGDLIKIERKEEGVTHIYYRVVI